MRNWPLVLGLICLYGGWGDVPFCDAVSGYIGGTVYRFLWLLSCLLAVAGTDHLMS